MFLYFLESACQMRIRQSKIGRQFRFFFFFPLYVENVLGCTVMHMKNYRSTDGPNVTLRQIARNLETEHLILIM